MTTKELIQQYVTAHADNRWMDASELEALLTEFAEKLKEPASDLSAEIRRILNDLPFSEQDYLCKQYAYDACVKIAQLQKEQDEKNIGDRLWNAYLEGEKETKEQMMKDAIEGWVARDEAGDIAIFSDKPHRDLGLGMWTPVRHAFLFPRKDEYPDVTWNSEPQKVKVIIIKE